MITKFKMSEANNDGTQILRQNDKYEVGVEVKDGQAHVTYYRNGVQVSFPLQSKICFVVYDETELEENTIGAVVKVDLQPKFEIVVPEAWFVGFEKYFNSKTKNCLRIFFDSEEAMKTALRGDDPMTNWEYDEHLSRRTK